MAFPRPQSALSLLSDKSEGALNRPPTASRRVPSPAPCPAFRPASAACSFSSTASKAYREASSYAPTVAQQEYDNNPPIGIFRSQLRRNSWFLSNKRAPSETRIGRPICKEIPVVTKSISRPLTSTSMGRPGTAQSYMSAASGMATGSNDRSAANVSTRLRSQVLSHRSHSSFVAASRPAFGVMEEDSTALVQSLSVWEPPQQDAKPESLPSHYRTTTKHGSAAHTIWDFIWEKPVRRDSRINREVRHEDDL